MAIRSDAAGNECSYLLDMLADEVGCVLEIGCGDGRLTRKYADRTARVFGVDLPATMPRAASKPMPDSVHMAAASGVHLPFPACRFDHVIFALSF
ncbi:MAG: class I SAM-dependent methyltransferase [Chloroflexi bacterium]|nr:class I SAM-dependent methyltransferase [Chloroflexota bacterium]